MGKHRTTSNTQEAYLLRMMMMLAFAAAALSITIIVVEPMLALLLQRVRGHLGV